MTNPPPNPHGQAAYPPYQPTGPARRGGAGRVVLIVVGVVLALCVGGTVLAVALSGGDDDKPNALSAQDQANRRAAATATSSPTPTTAAPTATKTSPAAAPTTTKPTKATPEPVVIGEGIYRVGEDIPAGRYKVVERAEGDCYWSRTKGDNIIDNSIAGGFPSFTTRKGEDVEIGAGCPEFKRIGK